VKVFDLFPFFNELDLLDLRLAELDPVVTDYGVSELPRTFTDKPKTLHFWANRDRWLEGRVFHHHLHQAIPSGPHPTVDWFQRRTLGQYLGGAEADDVVLLSDVDEIPNRERIREYIAAGTDHPVVCRMHLYYHRVDLLDASPWLGTVICRRKNLGCEVPDMQQLREDRGSFPVIENGGWHFSWLGDGKAIAEKLDAVDILRENAIYGARGIQEPPRDPGFLESCYQDGKDLFRRGRDKAHVPILPGTFHPHETFAWLAKHPQYARSM